MDPENQQYNIFKGYNMLMYFAGTMIMFDPSQECINDFWTKGILKTLPVTSQNPKFIKASSQLHMSVGDQNSTIEKMTKDYEMLFVRSFNPLAPPLESAYRQKGLITTEKHSPSVIDFYNSYGWESKFKKKIPDDHLGIELLFLTIMIEKYLEFDDEVCNSEMRNEIRRFINQHLLSWVYDWNDNVQNNADTLSYKGIATLVVACIEDIFSVLGENNSRLN
jgi:putative dimethyl sulfoxide reductase chaperone